MSMTGKEAFFYGIFYGESFMEEKKMNYETFKTAFAGSILDYLPNQYQNWKVDVTEVIKVNSRYDSVTIMPPGGTGGSPNLYVQEFFAFYNQCGDFQTVCRKAAAVFVMGMDYISRLSMTVIEDLPKDRIVFALIPQKGNEALLETVPHRLMMDLAIVYRVLLDGCDGGFDSTMVTKDMMEVWNLEEGRLYDLAMENTPVILPLDVWWQDNLVAIMTNEKRIFGAATVLYPGALKAIADQWEMDLFLIPSSIHDFFVIQDIGQDVKALNHAVAEGNEKVTPKEEFLSDHVYHYRRETDQICIPKW